jgi:hypothetical protein
MKVVFALISRNRKLFFKDRGMFFSALITPGILILLYATFLANVYRDSFVSAIPDMITISDKLTMLDNVIFISTYRCLSKYSFPNILHPGCFPVVAIYHNMFFLLWINLFHLTCHPSHPQLFLFLLYMILQHSSSLHDVKCRNSRVRCQFLLSARLAHRNS